MTKLFKKQADECRPARRLPVASMLISLILMADAASAVAAMLST
jgi:hypothetical protein